MPSDLPPELSIAEHHLLVSALIALEVQNTVSIQAGVHSPAVCQKVQAEIDACTNLRTKLFDHYLVPIPRSR